MPHRHRLRGRAVIAAAALLLIAGAAAENHRDAEPTPEEIEAEKSRESRANRVYVPKPEVPDPERLERLRLEQELLEAHALAAKDAQPRRFTADATTPPAPQRVPTSWTPAKVPREARGVERNGLQLSLIPDPRLESRDRNTPELARGRPLLLRLVLHNSAVEARRLEAVPACGSLDRADGLVFHVSSDAGERLVVPNAYVDIESVHEHPPLEIPGNGQLDGVLDLAELVHSSSDFASLLERSRRITVVAALPALDLESRPLDARVAPGLRGPQWGP